MRYLLDTDHISILQWKSEPEFSRLSSRLAQLTNDDYGVTALVGQLTVLTRNSKDFARVPALSIEDRTL